MFKTIYISFLFQNVDRRREVKKMQIITFLLFFTPVLVSGDESQPIVAMIKHHFSVDHWKDCLIVTLGLNSKIVNALVRMHVTFLFFNAYFVVCFKIISL